MPLSGRPAAVRLSGRPAAVRLSGAVVAVTGAGRGLGAATARLLDARGATVVAVGRDEAALRSVAGARGSVAVADLRDPASAERVVDAALSRHGRLDAVVANAGLGYAGDLAAMPVERAADIVAVNLLSPMLLARAALPAMRRQQAGSLVFVGSVAGALGVPGESVYSASKAAIDRFADVLREEVRADGLRVATVLPAVVDTGFFTTRGHAYDRRFPRALPAEAAARTVVDALERGHRRRFLPRWLAVPDRLHAQAPRLYRVLERRFG